MKTRNGVFGQEGRIGRKYSRQLLGSNTAEFIAQREQPHNLGMNVRQGLLPCGPPGTG
jgi:hypothetical protein